MFVMEHASELTKAVKATTAAAMIRAAGQKPAETTASDAPFFSENAPWYKTWWGVGAMAVGAAGIGSLLLARSRPASTGVSGYRRRRR
jgi:hypothetical protein